MRYKKNGKISGQHDRAISRPTSRRYFENGAAMIGRQGSIGSEEIIILTGLTDHDQPVTELVFLWIDNRKGRMHIVIYFF